MLRVVGADVEASGGGMAAQPRSILLSTAAAARAAEVRFAEQIDGFSTWEKRVLLL